MQQNFAQQPNLDQQAHDERMARLTPAERKLLAKRLANLARSKGLNEPDSSVSDTSGQSSKKSA